MTIQRRGLLGAILAGAAAPFIVKAGVLMPVRKLAAAPAWVGETDWRDWKWQEVPGGYARYDDTDRLQAMLDRGEPIIGGSYYITRPLKLRDYSRIECASIDASCDISLVAHATVRNALVYGCAIHHQVPA